MKDRIKSILFRVLSALKTLLLMAVMVLKSLLLLPILLFMVWVSYYIDPSAFFHGDKFELEAALALHEGHSLSRYEQLDERQINNLHVANTDEPYEVAVLGSSRALQIGEEFFPDNSYYNYGMISAAYIDLCNMFYTMVDENKVPDNVIMVLDPWVFYQDEFYIDRRSDVVLYQEYLTLALGQESDYVAPDNTVAYEALLSPSFFQSSVEYYLKGGSSGEGPEVLTGDIYSQEYEVKRYDGTIVYSDGYRNREQDIIDLDALSLASMESTFLHGFEELRQDGKDKFEELLNYILEQDTNVIFVLTPYHPIVYDSEVLKSEDRPGMLEVETYIQALGKKYDIPVHGSYDPERLGCDNTNFYDGIHVTADGIEKFFDPVLDDLV